MENMEQQGLSDHLRDLRCCLIISLAAVGVCFAFSYPFAKELGGWFFKPLFDVLPQESSLIFISYQEAFFFI